MNIKGKSKKNQVVTVNIFEQQEMIAKAEEIKNNLTACIWRHLEIDRKFDKNAKLTFISDDMPLPLWNYMCCVTSSQWFL